MALAKYELTPKGYGPLDQPMPADGFKKPSLMNTTATLSKATPNGKRCSRCGQEVGMTFGLADAPICEVCDAHLTAERRAKQAQSAGRGREV